jgi:tellurite resistance protein TehA-like permease
LNYYYYYYYYVVVAVVVVVVIVVKVIDYRKNKVEEKNILIKFCF